MPNLKDILQLYRDEYVELRAIAYSILASGSDADDVVQNTICKLLEREDLNEVSNPKAFLRKCIRNEAIDLYRKKRIWAVPVGEDIQELIPPKEEMEFDRVEGFEYIKAHLQRATPEIQQAFIAYVLDGYRISELARELGIKPDTLEKRFRRIKIEISRQSSVLFTMFIFVI